MKVFTKSPRALAAQKATMEFLLINHPLDCPICDQGGECELQDLALGYGQGLSRFTEQKRVVADQDIGAGLTRAFATIEEAEFHAMGLLGSTVVQLAGPEVESRLAAAPG